MAFDDLDFDDGLEDDEFTMPEESSNRMFIIVAGILGGVTLIAVICVAIYALVLLPRSREARDAIEATTAAQNTQVAVIVEQTKTADAMTAIVAAYTSTPTETPIPDTSTPVLPPTEVVAIATTQTVATLPAETATYMALAQTLDAIKSATVMPTFQRTSTLSQTGFADEVGLPAMLGIAALLIVVVFLARRLRTA